ncbi:MAG: adenylate/guanylate cyclase domain-containing protein [Pseudomonadota bacterium]
MDQPQDQSPLDPSIPTPYLTISEWLATQALEGSEIEPLFESLCERMRLAGISVARATVMWPALHPLFLAEQVVWTRDNGVRHIRYDDPDGPPLEWLTSPLYHLLKSDGTILRRHLSGPQQLVDFPLLEELAREGFSDYIGLKTHLTAPRVGSGSTGILTGWVCDRPSGFSDREVAGIDRLQRRFAVAFRAAVLSGMMRTICDVYLGPTAGSRVLNGQIRRGDGETITAVVWYADMRGSTALAEHMPRDDYLDLLNRYFECTAGAVSAHGGETLAFIGDAVLAIFPYDTDDACSHAARCAIAAAREALVRRDAANSTGGPAISFGIGLSHGPVMFGNIGVPDRLSFSVIGPTVNEVARLEDQTKRLDVSVAASSSFATLVPEIWQSYGRHHLHGIAGDSEIFGLRDDIGKATGL